MSTFIKPPLPQATWQLSMRDMQARDAELLRAVADWLVEVQTERQHGEWNTLPAEVIDELRKAADE